MLRNAAVERGRTERAKYSVEFSFVQGIQLAKSIPTGVILTGAGLQAEGRISRAGPRKIPHSAELRRVRDDAFEKGRTIRTPSEPS